MRVPRLAIFDSADGHRVQHAVSREAPKAQSHCGTSFTIDTQWRSTMKMVKSLLLGGAASLIAVAGAHAADLPAKAKAVEYVKVCSFYGAGFFYIPGTDTCIKIGGYLRAEYAFQSGNSDVPFNQ